MAVQAGWAVEKKVLETIRDLRVYLDFDEDSTTFATWPIDKFGQKLPANHIARGVRLGLSVWASVIPDMHFRFVASGDSANLILRFAPYSQAPSMGVDGWARAFLPEEWSIKANSDCGRKQESRRSDGTPCREWSENIITFNDRRWTASGADFASNRNDHEYVTWVHGWRYPHFRRKPGGPCTDGSSADATWSDTCVPFVKSPHHLEIHGVDLVSVVTHEFGHTLLGDHTAEPPWPVYVDWNRRPIVDSTSCVRLGPLGYSILFPGFQDKWWNHRGAFPADMKRLKDLGYFVEYPMTKWTMVLSRNDGTIFKTKDWSVALSKMIWPFQRTPLSRAQARRQYFLIDLERDSFKR